MVGYMWVLLDCYWIKVLWVVEGGWQVYVYVFVI